MVVYDDVYNLCDSGVSQKVLWHYTNFHKNDRELFFSTGKRSPISITSDFAPLPSL